MGLAFSGGPGLVTFAVAAQQHPKGRNIMRGTGRTRSTSPQTRAGRRRRRRRNQAAATAREQEEGAPTLIQACKLLNTIVLCSYAQSRLIGNLICRWLLEIFLLPSFFPLGKFSDCDAAGRWFLAGGRRLIVRRRRARTRIGTRSPPSKKSSTSRYCSPSPLLKSSREIVDRWLSYLFASKLEALVPASWSFSFRRVVQVASLSRIWLGFGCKGRGGSGVVVKRRGSY